jgi:AcrR family transcriptional regulator
MQSTGHGGRHLSQPEHSSGMMMTSIPWLKIAPSWGGQWRMQVSQLMQIDMSIRMGAFCHFGLRARSAMRSPRVAAMRARYHRACPSIDPRVKGGHADAVEPDRRLTAQGMERKQQLLDRAAELFAERGYAETRVIDIVRAAGVAKGLFYWYFDNKEALFEELAESIRLSLRRSQRAVLDPAEAPLRNLRRGTEASVAFMAEHSHFFSLLEVEGRTFTHVLRRGTEQHVNDTLNLIRAGQADGSVRDEDPKLLALGVVGAVGQYSHFHRTGRITLPLPELAAYVGRYVVRAVAADEDAAQSALRGPTTLAASS